MTTHLSLGLYDDRFDCAAGSAPPRRYAILSLPRTGSNYLCGRLHNLRGCLGLPMEYLHRDAIRVMGGRLFPGFDGTLGVDRYLDAVARVRTTVDGWFGIKIQPAQLLPLFGGDAGRAADFLRRFDRIIFMTRDDRLGQAISGAIAHATGVWFNFGDEPDLSEGDLERLLPLVERLLRDYEQEEASVRAIASRLADRPALHLRYEEMEAAAEPVFVRAAAFLGIDDAALLATADAVRSTRKPPGTLAARIRAAYLARTAGATS